VLESCSFIGDDHGELFFYMNGGPVFFFPYDLGAVSGSSCQKANGNGLIHTRFWERIHCRCIPSPINFGEVNGSLLNLVFVRTRLKQ